MVRFAICCDPIPGDEIVGYISRGRGVAIHTVDCERLQELDSERIIVVSWSAKAVRPTP
jgi:GTP pyrophosphokinase